MEDLTELSDVVRRVIAARVLDRHLVEDLTQETLLRVAAADPRLAPAARRAYAIVTARNLIISHARKESVHERHAHRVVDYRTLDGPEEVILEREETEALASALQQLEDDDRDLLLRHEAGGVPTTDLAVEQGTSTGAIAMRLARARAALRLEFVLAFRRIELPTQRCRVVLQAMAAGDRRRQGSLDAAGHLLRCPTCAQLARPVTERRRGIAAWLFIPVGEALRRAVRSLRSSRLTQSAVTAVATVAVVAGVVIARPGTADRDAVPAPTTTLLTATTPAATATTAVTGVAPAPTTVPQCPAPLPLDQVDPMTEIGCPIAPTTLTATAVPDDEGFWAQTDAAQPVWVQLIGEGESPIDIVAGARLVVTGMISEPAAGPIAVDPRIGNAGYILQVAFTDIAAG